MKCPAPLAAAITLALAASMTPASAATLSVGPGKTFAKPCQALTKAASGDIVEIDGAGSYAGDVCVFSASNLTIRGVNGRPKIDAAGLNAAGKGIWVVQGSNTVIDNVELSGAKVPDLNGAGIRLEGAHLTLRNSYLHDNEMGLLTSNDGISNIVIENTQFGGNGAGNGLSHNVYVGHVNSLIFRHNYSHDARVGHNLKSRAKLNTISYNRFSSSGLGVPSYEIDLPNAGTSYVIGNVVQQPASAQNNTLLAYGMEGASNPGQDLYVVNNTFINDNSSAGTFIRIGSTVTTPVLIQNNVFAGTGTVTTQTAATLKTNYHSLLPAFVDRANYDLRPAPGAPFIDAGSVAGTGSTGVSLLANREYLHTASGQARAVSGAIDIGAYEAAASTTTSSTSTTTSTTSTSKATTTTTSTSTTTTASASASTTTASTPTTTASSTTTTAPDTIKPSVHFTSPADGSKVAGMVTVQVAAADNRALAKLILAINGSQVASQTGSDGSLTYRWDTRKLRGPYTLTATVVDTANNQASTSITVAVRSW